MQCLGPKVACWPHAVSLMWAGWTTWAISKISHSFAGISRMAPHTLVAHADLEVFPSVDDNRQSPRLCAPKLRILYMHTRLHPTQIGALSIHIDMLHQVLRSCQALHSVCQRRSLCVRSQSNDHPDSSRSLVSLHHPCLSCMTILASSFP